MPNDEQPEKVWDEHDWERFLQQQDRKTEKYMELLERYIDDPNRDQIIAREMGWNHLLDQEGQQWVEKVDAQFTEEAMGAGSAETDEEADGDDLPSLDGNDGFGFEVHPLYQAAVVLAAYVDEMFEEGGDRLANDPVAIKLSGQTSLASAKLAAALSDDDIDEIGMTIAYLKRALRAITTGMECAAELHEAETIDEEQYEGINQQLFQVRDGIIELMGEYRAEWRRRFAS